MQRFIFTSFGRVCVCVCLAKPKRYLMRLIHDTCKTSFMKCSLCVRLSKLWNIYLSCLPSHFCDVAFFGKNQIEPKLSSWISFESFNISMDISQLSYISYIFYIRTIYFHILFDTNLIAKFNRFQFPKTFRWIFFAS